VIEKLFEVVEGVTVQKYDKRQRKEIIYSQPPDSFAAKVLLEFRFGKPAQAVDVTSQGKSLTVILDA